MSGIPLWMRLLRFYSLHTPFRRRIYRVASWLYQRLSVPDLEVEATLDGTLHLSLRLPIWVDYNIYCCGVYEEPLARFFTGALHPEATVFDVGAYIGQYTLLASKYAPRGLVVAFEPHPQSHTRLLAHVSKNKLNNVLTFPKAVGHEKGIAAFEFSHQYFDSCLIPANTSSECELTIVDVVTLDSLAKELNFRKIDVVKLDVEGAEGLVLRVAVEVLERFRPILIVEIDRIPEKRWGDSPESLLKFLEHYGYTIYLLKGWKIERLSSYLLNYANVIAVAQ